MGTALGSVRRAAQLLVVSQNDTDHYRRVSRFKLCTPHRRWTRSVSVRNKRYFYRKTAQASDSAIGADKSQSRDDGHAECGSPADSDASSSIVKIAGCKGH